LRPRDIKRGCGARWRGGYHILRRQNKTASLSRVVTLGINAGGGADLLRTSRAILSIALHSSPRWRRALGRRQRRVTSWPCTRCGIGAKQAAHQRNERQ